MATRLTIAIDGPAGSGKSTVARGVAALLGYLYLDSGAMYRAVALKALRHNISLDHEAELTALTRETHIELKSPTPEQEAEGLKNRVFLDGSEETYEIRSAAVAQAASRLATIAGVLAAWGMNIVKADAFANSAGVVLDTFHFVDLHRTLELNPSEIPRFRQSIADVVNNRQALEPLLKGRLAAAMARPPKVLVQTTVNFDDESSEHCTLMEIVTQDRPGLLYEIGSGLARLACNIEVALIDTEGQKAIDVFYLTAQGRKLTPQKQELLREVLLAMLA